MQKPKVIALVGPTGSGKSALGMYLAQRLGGEIVSADSRQVYRGMGVIARAPSKGEMRAVPHHMVGVATPLRAYSAGEYARAADTKLRDILKREKVPVVVGGTGFYADSLLRGLVLPQVEPDQALRATLAKKTAPQLFTMLEKLDPVTAERIDRHNPTRLVRAIEIARALGAVPPLTHAPQYEMLWLGIVQAEKKHEKLLRAGVEARLKAGMLAEARALRMRLPRVRFLSLGFEFVLLDQLLDKKITRGEFIEKMVAGEQGYTRRQLRWFHKHQDIVWVKNKSEALRLARQFISPARRLTPR